jgi:hypothetical protein
VLEMLEKGDVAGAQWWLDKTVEFTEAHIDGTGLPAFRGLWSGIAPETRGPAAIRVAAAALIGAGTGDQKAIATLKQARQNPGANALEKAQIDKALCESLAKAKRWDDLLVQARTLAASKTFSEEGFRFFVKAATESGKWKELELEAKKRFTANPSNAVAAQAVALALAREGDAPAAGEWAGKMDEKVWADDAAVTSAWCAILAGKPTQSLLESLTKGSGSKSVKQNLTIAMLQAALQMPDEAQRTLLAAIASSDYNHLTPTAWVVYQYVCEQYGFKEESEAALTRAQTSSATGDDLAQWVKPLLVSGYHQGGIGQSPAK